MTDKPERSDDVRLSPEEDAMLDSIWDHLDFAESDINESASAKTAIPVGTSATPPSEYLAYWQHYERLQSELGDQWLADYMNRAYTALASQIDGSPIQDHLINEALGNYRDDLAAQWVGDADNPGPLTRLILGGMAAATESVAQGASMNPVKTINLNIDWKLLSQQALDYARRYTFDLIRGLDDTTREQVRQAVTAWLESGAPLDELKKSIEAIFKDPVRAELIASTESARAYNRGAQERYRSLDVQQMTWQTDQDDLVCPLCGPMQDQVGEVGVGWVHPDTGDMVDLPLHPRCRCFPRPVMA